ncbi:MAG: asparagine synthase-related protein [Candidatus Odinarchaeum yellowstonii]|uniref:Asparagine synthase-related protein n=1 Tax=Odinarchaeota yellowstonii (strain LCB_4) TaxID=1841599 RepID=A0AAF0D2L5_ODILC|nr:MAG: asparagine synthase-related protein [Candidatus Odinarchaeum yellowstonii]
MNLFVFLTSNNYNKLLKNFLSKEFKYTHLWVNGEKIKELSSASKSQGCNSVICLQTNSKVIDYLNNNIFTKTPLVIYGELRGDLSQFSLDEISNKIKSWLERYINDEVYLRELLYGFFTKFIIVAIINGSVKIIGDHIGYYQLFYYSDTDFKLYSNMKKNIWIAKASPLKELEYYPKPSLPSIILENSVNERTIIGKLEELLTKAVLKQMPEKSGIGVMFSGGLDSLILAKILIKLNESFNNEITLITAGLEGSKDIRRVRAVSSLINLPVEEALFTIDDCALILPEILLTIEKCDTLNVSLAIPEFYALKKACEKGLDIVFTGQGADELFYGYHKYIEAFMKGLNVQKISDEDLLSLSIRNLEREMKIAFKFSLELKYPYLDPPLISYVRGIPINYKLKPVNNVLNSKYILRVLGEKLGVPSAAVSGKVAMQYGSGAMKAIRKIAYQALKNSTAQYKITEFLKKLYLDVLEKHGYT